jgi:SpoVK/Ycf46/Vps4 family AAA+-type ATPase
MSEDDTDHSSESEEMEAMLDRAIVQAVLSVQRTKRKRVTPVPNTLLPPPPLHPVNLSDLIQLAFMCQTAVYRDCQQLGSIYEPLVELQGMVGAESLKQSIVDLLLQRLQHGLVMPSLGHICITGAPGTGKTTVAGILAKLLSKLQNTEGHVVHFRPETAIAPFLGQTAPKVTKLIESAFGGVLLIDEVTSLADGRTATSSDSFSKTAIDILNRMLSEHGEKFTCIVAGYKDEIHRDFFSVNPGLQRRFTSHWHMDGYSPEEMCTMAKNLFIKKQCVLTDSLPLALFTERAPHSTKPPLLDGKVSSGSLFQHNAASIETFVDCVIRAHAKRVFGALEKNRISHQDVLDGTEALRVLNTVPNTSRESCLSMYT